MISLVFQEEILSSCPLVSVKHFRADLSRPHRFAEFEFHHPRSSVFIHKKSTIKRRYENKLQWVVSGRWAEVLAVACVFCWCCLLHILSLHHSHPANIVLKMQGCWSWAEYYCLFPLKHTTTYIPIHEPILNWIGMDFSQCTMRYGLKRSVNRKIYQTVYLALHFVTF